MDKHKGEQNIIQTVINGSLFFIVLAIQIVVLILLYRGTSNLLLYSEIIFNVIKICSVIYIVAKPINPSYKITWIVLITILPVLGVLLFLLLGNISIP